MLPDIRAVVAAVIVAVGLLAVSFGVVATFRVAQDNRAGSLQADLAQRGRALASPAVIETPAPLQAIPVAAVETLEIIEAAAGRARRRSGHCSSARRASASAGRRDPGRRACTSRRGCTPRACPAGRAADRADRSSRSRRQLRCRRHRRPHRAPQRTNQEPRRKPPPQRRYAPRVSPASAGWQPPGAPRTRNARSKMPLSRQADSTPMRSGAASATTRSAVSAIPFHGHSSAQRLPATCRANPCVKPSMNSAPSSCAEPPRHAAFALSACARQHQHELVRHLEFGMQPHAAIGNVGDPAIARQRARAEA